MRNSTLPEFLVNHFVHHRDVWTAGIVKREFLSHFDLFGVSPTQEPNAAPCILDKAAKRNQEVEDVVLTL
jgi:hypothetical protein